MHFFGKYKKKNRTLFVSLFGLPKINIDQIYIEMVNILYFNKNKYKKIYTIIIMTSCPSG